MKFTLASVSLLLASCASATPFSTSASATITPSGSSSSHVPSYTIPPSSVLASIYSAIPTRSWSSIAAAGSFQAAKAEPNTEFFDCVFEDYGCDWMQNSYAANGTHCGVSPYKPGHVTTDGNVIMAVSRNSTGDCVSQAGSKCCKVLARDPCRSGERYLECQTF